MLRGGVLAIPEILDLTIDHLSSSKPDLSSCALVSRLWLKRAQYHIFANISLTRALSGNETEDHKAVWKLYALFEKNPRLASLVRSLSASLEICVLITLARMPLSNLNTLTLYCTSPQRARRADRVAIPAVQRLLRLPAIRVVNLDGAYPSIPVLNDFFHGFSRTITLKGIHGGQFIETGEGGTGDDDALTQPTLRDGNVRPRPPLFGLAASKGFGPWLGNPAFPFDLSDVAMIVTMTDYWAVLHGPLIPALPKLTYLKLLEFSGSAQPYLTTLPLLRKLKLSFVPYDAAGACAACVRTLGRLAPGSCFAVLSVRLHTLAPADEAAFRRLDADVVALSKTVLRSLARVEFNLPKRQDVTAATLESWFPKMVAQNWLDVVRVY
ncbi:hypothetical protein DFH07DRAFT_1065625 [Mycena maculata]|uniref:Uncharacterized protein n=1 Tax=Mycena maculata TaxID=230809 RepID=A0AAD7I050_9AGAR|nr:hypothetical protein DFH07DRAFT_1065625 [Mycena maculata]